MARRRKAEKEEKAKTGRLEKMLVQRATDVQAHAREKEEEPKERKKSASGKTDVRDKIEQFKKDRKEKKSLLMLDGKKKRSDSELVDTESSADLTESSRTANVDAKFAFLTKGAFFVTATESNPAATIKLHVTPDFQKIVWKEHTSKTHNIIELKSIVGFKKGAVLRPSRDKLGMSILYRDEEEVEQEFLLEAISERVKTQWLGSLAELTEKGIRD